MTFLWNPGSGIASGATEVTINEKFTVAGDMPTITLAAIPKFGLEVDLNGSALLLGVDYTVAGAVITFLPGLVAGDEVAVRYY